MSGGAAEREQGARRSGEARMSGIEDAKGDISRGYSQARGEIEPITELYGESKNYFDQYNTPGGLATLYQRFTSSTDPLYNYYETKSAEQLNKQLAARGKFGGGYSLESHAERVGKLGAEIAGLTEQRVQNELGLKERMMDRGISAKGTIAQYYQQEGSDLANLSLQYGAARGAMEEGISEARAMGKQNETAWLTTAAGAAAGFIPGVGPIISSAMLGQDMTGAISSFTGGQAGSKQPSMPGTTSITAMPGTSGGGGSISLNYAMPQANYGGYTGQYDASRAGSYRKTTGWSGQPYGY